MPDEKIVKLYEGTWNEALVVRGESGEVTFSAYQISETNPHTAIVHDKAALRSLLILARDRMGKHPVIQKKVVLPGEHCYHLSAWAFSGFVQLNVNRGHGATDLERFQTGNLVGSVAYMFSPIYPDKLDELIEMLAE